MASKSSAAVAVTAALLLGACTVENLAVVQTRTSEEIAAHAHPNLDLKDALSANLNRHVAQHYPKHPVVLDGAENAGIDASRHFFDSSETVVVSGTDISDQLRAASIAVVSHAPMLTIQDSNRNAVLAEIHRLGARYVLVVGDTKLAATQGELTIIKDPGTAEALGMLTAFSFKPKGITFPHDVPRAVAALGGEQATLLQPGWIRPTTTSTPQPAVRLQPFPAQSRRDADTAPIVLASAQSSVAAIATARAFGATVRILEHPDPRFNVETMRHVTGLSDQPVVALGSHFGSADQLAHRIKLLDATAQYQPGEGKRGLVFPKRIVVTETIRLAEARPDAPLDVREKIAQLKRREATHGQVFDGIISPSFVLDATAMAPHVVDVWVDAISQAGGYALIIHPELNSDPGWADILKKPNVGVALEKPTIEQFEVTQNWLATMVRNEGLPQKILLVDQVDFSPAQCPAPADELAVVWQTRVTNPDRYHAVMANLPVGIYPGLSLEKDDPATAGTVKELNPRPVVLNRYDD
ncbi:putative cell wall binding protein [Corynebacterium mustelae]|uniref:Putative cell wall binding protein n=1 Tax=Corynebacterium mustelae TaxID=571915 RepID=A0A0G3H3S0_9CORY|nr:cell wall-binding repeat-containing protein [Corynebacterium mustelae]AKK05737.1 putative cell wall binding protein [Corynebacterium mustelae]